MEAVIKNLAKSGKTMLIVTHEMNFARAISDRVFYMDEGVIYEDDSPSHIIGNIESVKRSGLQRNDIRRYESGR